MSENNLKQQLQTARDEMNKRPLSVAGSRMPDTIHDDEAEEEVNEEAEANKHLSIRERYLQMQKQND